MSPVESPSVSAALGSTGAVAAPGAGGVAGAGVAGAAVAGGVVGAGTAGVTVAGGVAGAGVADLTVAGGVVWVVVVCADVSIGPYAKATTPRKATETLSLFIDTTSIGLIYATQPQSASKNLKTIGCHKICRLTTVLKYRINKIQ